MKVAFIHPDLGIGGAERLIVDAALALVSSGHEVRIFTSHHDPKHCFSETADGTLAVKAVGDWLPRRILGLLYAFCAILRMMYVSLYVVFFGDKFDVIVVDQVSACIPVLKIFSNARIFFYCHFPDLLLSQRSNLLKSMYRLPLDILEEATTGFADATFVNSEFTAKTFSSTFSILSYICPTPKVLYPSLNFSAFDVTPVSVADLVPSGACMFLSINRFERKKNLPLALHALANLRKLLKPKAFSRVHLVMAGGYDPRVVENVEHYEELVSVTKELDLVGCVTFKRSFSDEEKVGLLNRATALIYTPTNEHFGICPLEAMYMGRPVIACNSGGPKESVADCVTGYLCEASSEAFASKMELLVQNEHLQSTLGESGRKRVVALFSFAAFTKQLNQAVCQLGAQRRRAYILYFVPIAATLLLVLLARTGNSL